jgi:hypothetical protein
MHDANVPTKEPVMKDVVATLKNRTQMIEELSVGIKKRISFIDGNVPPENTNKTDSLTPNCLQDELQQLIGRLSVIEHVLEECQSRLINQLG